MLLSQAKKDGVATNLIMCRCIIGESHWILLASILALHCFFLILFRDQSGIPNVTINNSGPNLFIIPWFENPDSTLISLKGMCLRRFERSCFIGEPVLSFDTGRPQINNKWYVT